MAFDVEGALKAGYSRDEIADFLAAQSNFDVAGAKKAGYTSDDIIGYLGAAAPAEPAAPAGKTDTIDNPFNDKSQTAPAAEPGILDRVAGLFNSKPASVMDGYTPPTKASDEQQAEIDRRLSYGAGPISNQAVAEADQVRAGIKRSSEPVVNRVASEMNRRQEYGIGDALEAARRDDVAAQFEDQAMADARRKTARENPLLGAMASGSAGVVSGTINTPSVVADAFNQTVVNPILESLGLKPLDRVPTAFGTEYLAKGAQDYMPTVGKQDMGQAWENNEFAPWLMSKLAANSPQIAQSLAAAFVPPLRAALLPTMGAQAAGQSYADGDDSRVALTKGAVEIVTEMLPLGVFDKIGDVLKGFSPTRQNSILAVAAQRLLQAGGAITANALTNAIEETAAQLGNNALDKYFEGKDIELTDRLGESAVVGAAVGKAMSLPQVAGIAAGAYDPNTQLANAINADVAGAQFTTPASQLAAERLNPQTYDPQLIEPEQTVNPAAAVNRATTVDEAIANADAAAGTLNVDAPLNYAMPAAPLPQQQVAPTLPGTTTLAGAEPVAAAPAAPAIDPQVEQAFGLDALRLDEQGRPIGDLTELPGTGATLSPPRPQRINGAPVSTLTDDQLRGIVEDESASPISRRGASIELDARRAELGGRREPTLDTEALLANPGQTDGASAPAAGNADLRGPRIEPVLGLDFLSLPDTGTGAAATLRNGGAAPVGGERAARTARGNAQASLDRWAQQENQPVPALVTNASPPELDSAVNAIAQAVNSQFGGRIYAYHDPRPDALNGIAVGQVAFVNTANVDINAARTSLHEFKHTVEQIARAETAQGLTDTPAQRFVAQIDSLFDDMTEEGKRAYVTKFYGKDQLDKIADPVRREVMLQKLLTSAKLRSEMTADFLGNRATDRQFWRELAAEDPQGFKAFVDKWLQIIDNLLATLRGKANQGQKESARVDKYVRDLNKAKAVARQALVEYSRATRNQASQPAAPTASTVATPQASQREADFVNPEERVEVSTTRPVPNAKKNRTSNSYSEKWVIDGADVRASKTHVAAVMRAIRQYNTLTGKGNAETLMRELHETIVENLLWLHDLVPEAVRARAKLWYDGANRIANDWSGKYQVSLRQVSGVLAVLSPQMDWFKNVSLGERVLTIWKNRQNEAWSPAMTAWLESWVNASKDVDTKASRQAILEQARPLQGMTLAEMTNRQAAIFVRVFDETYHERQYRLVTPEGGFGDYVTNNDEGDARVTWGGFDTIEKAVSILNDGSFKNIENQLGNEHKVRNFYNNIVRPGSADGHVTIDTHAVAAALIKAVSGSSREVDDNFGAAGANAGTGASGTYGLFADAYRDAAARRGILPREMQSITWEAVRALFPAAIKDQLAPQVDAIWNRFRKGEISRSAARNEVKALAGGLRPMAWEGSSEGTFAADGGASFNAEIPEAIDERAARTLPPEIARDKVTVNLSANTSSIPGVAELQAAAARGNPLAHQLLQDIALDNLRHLLAGTSARIKADGVTGLYGGYLESGLSMTVSFADTDRAQVLAGLAKFADNFNQEQVHVRQGVKAKPGTTFADGSYATPAYRWELKKTLSRKQIEKVIDESGLAGLTFGDDFVEAYYVGEPSNEAARKEFDESIDRAGRLLGRAAQSVKQTVERLWPYGRGAGAIGFDRIQGDVSAGTGVSSETAKRVAGYLNATKDKQGRPALGRVKTFEQQEITPQQDALQTRIAQVYDSLPENDLKNPTVRKAYAELAKEVVRQFKALPVKVEVYTKSGEPYANSDAMRRDVLDNNRLYIFGTTPDTFGPAGQDFSAHPLLADTGITDQNGYALVYNDLLRAVHDYYAHSMSPVQFGPKGEEAAWKNHMAMTPNLWARWALTMETRAQNSWVNFRDGMDRATPMSQRSFAPQKAALLPIEFALTGDKTVDRPMKDFIARLGDRVRQGSKPVEKPAMSARQVDTPEFKRWFDDSRLVSNPAAINSDFESILEPEEFAYEWRRAKIPLDLIDRQDDFIDENRLAAIAANDRKDQEPIILTVKSSGRFKLLDGAHRLTAAQSRGEDRIDSLIGIPPNIRRSARQPNTSPFYSQLARAIDQVADRLATQPAAQWKAWLASNAAKLGVKKDELEWTGINEYLDLRGKDKVTKAELAEYLGQNGVQVQEVMRGSTGSKPYEIIEAADEEGGWNLYEPGYDAGEFIGNFATYSEAEKEAKTRNGEDSTKYASYTLPGGENYRELLLTLPEKTGPSPDAVAREMFGRGMNNLSPDDQQKVRANLRANEAQNYKSGHWDEKNILAHIRFNDRVDADGKKVLFIEELQSDWAQKGRKEGFKGRSAEDAKKFFDIRDEDWAGMSAEQREQYRQEMVDYKGRDAIPSAPFVTDTKAWVALAVKRMIAYAVDNGYDKVAFVNGEQSADRYDLSKSIDSLIYAKEEDGTFSLVASKDGRELIKKDNVPSTTLPDLVGKEMADKMARGEGKDIGAGEREFAGLDLKVGGEGMKSFYDRIVPQVINDVLKKVGGGKVETVDLSDNEDRSKYFIDAEDIGAAPDFEQEVVVRDADTLDGVKIFSSIAEAKAWLDNNDISVGAGVQPGFAITDAMREKVSTEGLPLFSKRQAPDTPEFKAWFGGSQVVDQNGNPLVVYHGTVRDSGGVFDPGLAGKSGFERTKKGTVLKGIHFTNTAWRADMYAKEKDPVTYEQISGGHIVPVYLSIKNPLVFNHPKLDASDAALRHKRDIEWVASGNSPYDGVIVQGIAGETDYIVFNSNQAKSVFNERPTNSEDIRRSTRQTNAPDWVPEKIWKLHELAQRADDEATGRVPLRENAQGNTPRPSDLKRNQTMTFRRLMAAVDEYVGGDYTKSLELMARMNEESNRREGVREKENPDIRRSTRQTDSWLISRDELGRLRFGAGAKAYRLVADVANAVLEKVSLKPISPELSRAMRRMRSEIDRAQTLTANVAARLKDLPDDERQMISDVIEQELRAGVTPPQRVLALAASMQSIMSQQSAELVRLGMLTPDAANRWDGKYLPRFYEQKLGDEVKAWAKAARSLFGRARTMQGIKGDSLKARGIFKTIPVAELAQWQAQGWEERDPSFDPATDTEIQIWRDFTRREREQMGEIRDSMFRFVMGYMKSQRDIALGRLFENLAATVATRTAQPGFVKVPDTIIEDTQVRRYGQLAGKWVPKEVLDHLSAFDSSQQNDLIKMYLKGLSMWKEGKALALTTPIPTPAGWTTMGELKVGDQVFDENGKACNVLFATDVQLDRKCYEVEFSDGEVIVADAEHLWFTQDRGSPGVRTTEAIAATLKYAAGKYNRHSVPVAGALDLPEADLPVDPYFLGVWLGDGSSRRTEITSSEADSLAIMALIKERGFGIGAVRKDPRGDIVTYQVGFNEHRPRKELLQPTLRSIGVLGNKHIPPMYLRASERQRMDLLCGLMDTDGTVDKNGKVSFCTASDQLLNGFMELARSLGFKPVAAEVTKKFQGGVRKAWVVRMHATAERPVFFLERKRARLQAPTAISPRSGTRQIVAIRPVDSVPVKCIQVSSDSRLYLAGHGMVPTHNTVLNPVSHVNNVVSNVTMAHFAGVSYWDLHKYAGAVTDLVKNAAMVQEAKANGLFGGTFKQSEIIKSMPPQLRALAAMSESRLKRGVDTLWTVLSFGLRRPAGWAYDAEDQFFRYVLYRDARLRGLDPEESVEWSQQFIFRYDELPKGARVIRDVGIPFFSYVYQVVPALSRTALEKPWRFAAPAVVLATINALMYAMAASDDDEDWKDVAIRYLSDAAFREKVDKLEAEERQNLPPWSKGRTALGTPKTIRLWQDEATKLPLFMDTSRLVPGGDLFDNENNAGGLGIFQPMMPSNPVLTTIVAMLFNKDTFTGRDVVDKSDTDIERAEKRGKWLWRQFTPAVAVGNYHWDKAMNALANLRGEPIGDYTGVGRDELPVQPKYAAAQTVGIKIRPIDLEMAEFFSDNDRKRMISDLEAKVRRIDRLEDAGVMSEQNADRERTRQEDKIDRLSEGLTVNGDVPR